MTKRTKSQNPKTENDSNKSIKDDGKTKENIVVILFIVGFIFIIISTFNFVYQIPNLEIQISNNEEALRISDNNFLLFSLYQFNENSIKNQMKMLSDLNPNSTKIKSLQAYLYNGDPNICHSRSFKLMCEGTASSGLRIR